MSAVNEYMCLSRDAFALVNEPDNFAHVLEILLCFVR